MKGGTYRPGTVLGSLKLLSYLPSYYSLHFTDKEVEAQGDDLSHPRSYSKWESWALNQALSLKISPLAWDKGLA